MRKASCSWKWFLAIVPALERMLAKDLFVYACGRSLRMNRGICVFLSGLAAILMLSGVVARGQVSLPAPGDITTVAGGGLNILGGLAVNTNLDSPDGVAVDTSGNFYIAEYLENRIDKVTASTGIITVVAGNNGIGSSGDGGAATAAQLNDPTGVAVDAAGNIYIADSANNRIRKVTASNGIITTVAGTGKAGFSGDGGSATSAELYEPYGVAVDGNGNIYIADNRNQRIRMVTVSTGNITTVAGNGGVYTDFGSIATNTGLWSPEALAVDATGDIYIAITHNNQIGMVSASTGIITLVAGTGARGFYGDGGPATSAAIGISVSAMAGVAVDAAGNVYIGDFGNDRIRKVTAATGIITTIAGGSTSGFSGDGGPATSALLQWPIGVAADAEGNVYFADYGNNRIRAVAQNKVTPTISWSTPASITYGTALSSTQLDATASEPGTFVYSPTSGTVLGGGSQTLSASFTPYDTDDYNSASATVSLQVNKVTPTVSVFCSPNPITYGGANSICTVYVSDGATGTMSLTINGAAWTIGILSSGSATAQFSSTYGIGTFTVGATYNGDSNNATAAGSGTVTVNQISQTIAFTPPVSPVTFGAAPITLSATGGASGNPVVFSIVSGPGSVSGSTLTVTGAGTVVVAANQAGNIDYALAAQVTQSVVVNKASQTIIFTAPASPVTYGVSPIGLSATGGTSGNAIVFSILSGPGSISGNTLTITGVGALSIAANQAGNANYVAAAQVTQSIFVNQASSTISVASSGNPSIYSMLVTFTATLTSGASGSVTFYDGGTAIGTGVISGTTATFSTSVLVAGSHSITASWAGNSDYTGATSNAIPQIVNKESVTVSSASSLSPSVYGDNVAWTFTVTGSGVLPTGTVTIKVGTDTLVTVPLNAGIATYNTSALVAGSHTLTAVYSGDNNYQ